MGKLPAKPALPEPPETSLNTNPAKVLFSPNRRKTLWLHPEQGSTGHILVWNSHPFLFFPPFS